MIHFVFSHENLYTVEGEDMKMMLRDGMMTSRSSPLSAEAPELSTTPQSEVLIKINFRQCKIKVPVGNCLMKSN